MHSVRMKLIKNLTTDRSHRWSINFQPSPVVERQPGVWECMEPRCPDIKEGHWHHHQLSCSADPLTNADSPNRMTVQHELSSSWVIGVKVLLGKATPTGSGVNALPLAPRQGCRCTAWKTCERNNTGNVTQPILLHMVPAQTNFRTLGKAHEICLRWAKRHGATVNP